MPLHRLFLSSMIERRFRNSNSAETEQEGVSRNFTPRQIHLSVIHAGMLKS